MSMRLHRQTFESYAHGWCRVMYGLGGLDSWGAIYDMPRLAKGSRTLLTRS